MHTLLLQWQVAAPFLVMGGASDSRPLQTALQPNPKWCSRHCSTEYRGKFPARERKGLDAAHLLFRSTKFMRKASQITGSPRWKPFIKDSFTCSASRKKKTKKKAECKERAIPISWLFFCYFKSQHLMLRAKQALSWILKPASLAFHIAQNTGQSMSATAKPAHLEYGTWIFCFQVYQSKIPLSSAAGKWKSSGYYTPLQVHWSLVGMWHPKHPTSVTEVIHQHNLCHQLGRGAVQDAVHGPQQGGPSLVVEWDYHTGVWQLLQVQLVPAAGHRQSKSKGAARHTKKTPKTHQYFHINYQQATEFFLYSSKWWRMH